MAWVFDLLLLILVILIVICYGKRGFISASVGFARIFLAFLVSFLFSTTLASAFPSAFPGVITSFVSFLILLVVSYFALRLLVPSLSKMMRKIPLIKSIDTFGGVAFGIFRASLWGWIFALLCVRLLPLMGIGVSDTVLIKFFNSISPVNFITRTFLR